MTRYEDTFAGNEDERRDKASAPILAALKKAEDEFREWDATCHLIDDVYSRHGSSYEGLQQMALGWGDTQLDLFWSSFEVLKPAVYARPPKPAVAPLFKDGSKLKTTTAELLERAATSAFMRTGIDDVMQEVRDDLLFAGRGVMWLRYEDDDGQKVCVEHLDRTDFLHEPARKWSEVGWVAGGFWLTREELKKRFSKLTDDQLDTAKFTAKRDDDHNERGAARKARVWEVWHRADNKVYWVTDGIDVLLDSDEPHLKLSGFFPCPRPAYATLRRRSLVPVPDYERYSTHFAKISNLTRRIYLLLDSVRLKGLIPAGGDVGDAVEQLMASNDDQILIPVPGAAMMAQGASGFVQWMPMGELAQAIQGLIDARSQLISDFYELSGISDIMRGATEAQETLGAQQLKSQYGSVRVRGKIDELQRVAADAVRIAAEIIADKFTEKTLLEMAQMDLLTSKQIEKRIKEIEDAAGKELKALGDRAREEAEQAQASGQPVDPAQAQQAQQMMQQAQQEILAKYGPMLAEAEQHVAIDDIVKLLRDDRARSFAFEIETDSTILTDEMQEKQSRNEFMGAFTQATGSLMQMAGMGEEGAKLAGEMMKFVLAPYRVGRQLDGAIDAFLDAAPELAAQMKGEAEDDGVAALAEAEKMKAEAAMERVQAQREKDQAEFARRMQELEQKAQNDQAKHASEAEKLRLQGEQNTIKTEEALAKIDLLRAQTMKAMNEAGVVLSDAQLDEFKSLADIELRQNDQAMKAENQAIDRQFRARGEERADVQALQQTNKEPENG